MTITAVTTRDQFNYLKKPSICEQRRRTRVLSRKASQVLIHEFNDKRDAGLGPMKRHVESGIIRLKCRTSLKSVVPHDDTTVWLEGWKIVQKNCT